MIASMNQTRTYNQVVDQIEASSQVTIKYLVDNYRVLTQNLKKSNNFIVYTDIGNYIPSGHNAYSKYYETPCLLMSWDTRLEQIIAYLIFAPVTPQVVTYLDTAKIAYKLGVNAGVLLDKQNKYTIKGGIFNEANFLPIAIDDISTKCKIKAKTLQNGLIIELTKDGTMFAAIKNKIDQIASQYDPDPSLKKNGIGNLTTMQTNLYLDNVTKEASSFTKYYCDANRLDPNAATTLCSNYAKSIGHIHSGKARWTASVMSGDNKSCQSASEGQFTHTTYACSDQMFKQNLANSICQSFASLKGWRIVGDGYWSSLKLAGNKCISSPMANFDTSYRLSCPNYPHNPHNICGWNAKGLWMETPRLIQKQCAYQWHYDKGMCAGPEYFPMLNHGGCDKYPRDPRNICGWNAKGLWMESPRRIFQSCAYRWHYDKGVCAGPEYFDPKLNWYNRKQVVCFKEKSVDAQVGQSIPETKFCGVIATPVLTNNIHVPSEHVYKHLDYGPSAITGKRIQIRTNAPDGAAQMNSQLNINNAGLQAGFIAPNSHFITPGSECSVNELGKIVQQLTAYKIAGGQLQCEYNPTFCSKGYCYLPIKGASLVYQYNQPQQLGVCPSGTIVDDIQPSDGVVTSVNCPSQQWLTLIQGAHGAKTSCYTSASGFVFCQAYHTVCTYNNGSEIEVPALMKYQCSTATATYTVNYNA